MGNHEYCIKCGESDFHSHRPCDPEKVRLKQAEIEERQKKKDSCRERMILILNSLGLKYYLDENGAFLSHWDF